MSEWKVIFKLLENKSKFLSIHMVMLHQDLTMNHKEFFLSQKLLENGTGIGEKIAEMASLPPETLNQFKVFQVLPFLNKTRYWLNLLFELGHVDDTIYNLLIQELDHIKQVLETKFSTLLN